MIYFDNNATTRVFDEVADAMRPYLVDRFANPASAVGEFAGVGRAIAAAKATVARILKADGPDCVIATSGATEANNLAILGAARANPKRRHIVTSSIEHPSVLKTAKYLESTGYRLTVLPVSSDGLVRCADVQGALTGDTLLVSVMLANNETGVIQPIGEIARLVQGSDRSILIHSDATQAVGKVAIDLDSELAAVDLLSFSAHKFHGPKGVGALFVRNTNSIAPLFHGGGQQLGLRPGTENPAGLVGMSAALVTLTSAEGIFGPVQKLRDQIQERILSLHSGSFALGSAVPRLPNTLNICIPGITGGDLVDHMATAGIAISTGSACAHGANKPSHVVLAMGLSYPQADCCVRISLSVQTTQQEADELLDFLAAQITSNVTI